MKLIVAITVVLIATMGHASQYDTPDAQTLVSCRVEIKELGISELDVVKDSTDAQIQFVLISKGSGSNLDRLISADEMSVDNIYVGTSSNGRQYFLIKKSGVWTIHHRDISGVGWIPCH